MSLTHKEVESLCDKFMHRAGWRRSGRGRISQSPRVIADRVYFKGNEIPLLFEIKPENALDEEIKRGIGQLVCSLPYMVKPYLIMSASKIESFKPIYSQLSWLGVMTYQGNQLSQQKKSQGTAGQIPIPILPIAIPGPKELIAQVIASLKGHYSTQELVTILSSQLPGYQFFSRYVGHTLVQLGYKKKAKEGVNGFLINIGDAKSLNYGITTLHPDSTEPTVPSVPASLKGSTCPKCGGVLQVRRARRGGPFFGCVNYPECRFTSRYVRGKLATYPDGVVFTEGTYLKVLRTSGLEE